MSFQLRKLTIKDGMDIYEMLQEIPRNEDGFINSVNGKTFEEYKSWLTSSNNTSKGIGLPDWKVPTTIYWLYADGQPVGIGKLRHYLTDKLKEEGGQLGYSIRPSQRQKGYGTILLNMLIKEAKKMNIPNLLLTIKNTNTPSIKVALNNNGVIEKITEERHYIWINL
ncbi:GNAT family N-acetyltransferase [Alloiococcus sp. CFN-8]|uniref:GNAT family N-acetyltransferase n=1 Tax=Alloiococcus sp. CFN-8 TaxID=3416081 RepID=UPI003CFA79BF